MKRLVARSIIAVWLTSVVAMIFLALYRASSQDRGAALITVGVIAAFLSLLWAIHVLSSKDGRY